MIIWNWSTETQAEIKPEQNQAELYISTLSCIVHNFYLAMLGFASLTVEVSTFQNTQDLSIWLSLWVQGWKKKKKNVLSPSH